MAGFIVEAYDIRRAKIARLDAGCDDLRADPDNSLRSDGHGVADVAPGCESRSPFYQRPDLSPLYEGCDSDHRISGYSTESELSNAEQPTRCSTEWRLSGVC